MKKFNIKSLLAFVVALIMVLSISACATEEVSDASATDEVATEIATDVATEVATEETGVIVPEFTFNNTGAEEICEIYLSPVGQDQWGPDQLGGTTIPSGGSYVLQNIPAGQYDVKAIGCAGSEVIGQLDIQPQQ